MYGDGISNGDIRTTRKRCTEIFSMLGPIDDALDFMGRNAEVNNQ
jgi:hypothetical protein